jgi:hypothetical protein
MALGAAFEKMGASVSGAAQALSNLMERTTSFDEMWKVSALSGMGAQEFVKELKSEDPTRAIANVSSRLLRMSEFQRMRYLKNILGFSEEEALLWSNIAKHPQKFASQLAESNRIMRDSQRLTEMFGDRTASLRHQWSLVGGQFENLKVALASGVTPVLTALATILSGILRIVNTIPAPILSVVGALGALIAAPAAAAATLFALAGAVGKLSSFLASGKAALLQFIGAKQAARAVEETNKMTLLANASAMHIFKLSVIEAKRRLLEYVGALYSKIKTGILNLPVTIKNTAANYAKAASEKASAAASWLSMAATKVLTGAKILLTTATWKSVGAALASAAAWTYQSVAMGLATIGMWALTAATWALNNVPIVLAVLAIVGALYALYKIFGPTTTAVMVLTGALIALAVAFYATPVGWIAAAIAGLIALLYALRDPIQKAFGTLWEWSSKAYESIKSVIDTILDLGYVFFLVSNPIGWTIGLFGYFRDAVVETLETIYKVFQYVGQSLWDAFMYPLNTLIEVFKIVGEFLWKYVGLGFEKIKNIVTSVYSGITTLFSAVSGGVNKVLFPLKKLYEAFDWLRSKITGAKESTHGSGFLHIPEGIHEAMPGIVSLAGAFHSVSSAASTAASKVASVSSSAAAAAAGIGQLAGATNRLQGATVRGISVVKQVVADVSPETSPIAAEAAAALRGSVVSPAAMMPAPAAAPGGEGGGASEISITVPVMIDGEQIAMAVAKVSKEELIRHHGRPGSAMRGVPL